MRINDLPALPDSAEGVVVPCSYNGADYKVPLPGAPGALPLYQSGDDVSGYFYAFGYITSSSKDVWICCPMPKIFQSGATLSVLSLIVSLRVVNGGYLGNNTVDMTAKLISTECQGGTLIIKLSSASAFTYGSDGTSAGTVTNNTPLCGYISLQAGVN